MNFNNINDVYSQFNAENKFAGASKKFLQGKNSPYKIFKTTTEYLTATVEILSIIPERFLFLFEIFKAVKSAIFESWGISRRVTKIRNCYQKETRINKKFDKWNQNTAALLEKIIFDDTTLLSLKEKYIKKIDKISFTQNKLQNKEIKQIRWLEYLEEIDSALEGNKESNLSFLNKLKIRSKNKLTYYENEIDDNKFKIKKNYIGIAISVGTIAIEIISLIGLAYTKITGKVVFTVIKLTSNLAMSGLKYFKFLWISKVKNEKLYTVLIGSIDHIGVAILKTKMLSTPNYLHHSLVQGGCQSILSTISIFRRRENYFNNIEDQNRCDGNMAQLEKKRIRLLLRCDRIAKGSYQALLDEKERLKEKISEAQFRIASSQKCLQFDGEDANLEHYQTQIKIFNKRIKKYNTILEIVNKAIATNHLSDAEKVSKVIIAGTNQKLNDWKLSKKLNAKRNSIDIMETALSIIKIARFTFLALSVYLTAVGIGVNLIPALFLTSLISNAVYIGYYWKNRKIVDEINQIYRQWKGNVPSIV